MARLLLLSLMLWGGLATVPVAASDLYRCLGRHGEKIYSSTATGYRKCQRIGHYPEATAAAPAKTEVAAPTPGTVEFRTAVDEASLPALPAGPRVAVTRGVVYRLKKNGVTHYTNVKPAGQSYTILFSYIQSCYACGEAAGVNWHSVGLNLAAYTSEIAAAASENQVDESLIRAIIHAESAFDPNALSSKGAQGLMQLMPDTAERFGVSNAFLAGENIRGGVSYLSWLLKRFAGDTKRVAAAYNAGEGAVDRHGGIPPYEETQRFVERVDILRQRYQGALAKRVQ